MCFNNLISYRGADVPTSGVYLDQIGVSLQDVNNIVGGEYQNGESLIKDKMDLAVKTVSDRVVNYISDYVRQTSVVDSQRIGFYHDNLIPRQSNQLKGIRIEICNETSFLDLFISDLSLQIDHTGEVEVFVYDLIQNKLIDTLTVEAKAGEISTLLVNKTYKSSRRKLNLAFVYSSEANSYKSTVKLKGCSNCNSGTYRLNEYIKATGVKISGDKILKNTESTPDTGGMSLNYSLQCNVTEYLCTFSNLMALTIAYKTAFFLMEYALHSSSRNNTLTFDPERIKDRMEYYDFEYQKSKSNLLKNIKIPKDSVCFQCKDRFRTVSAF